MSLSIFITAPHPHPTRVRIGEYLTCVRTGETPVRTPQGWRAGPPGHGTCGHR